MMRGDNAFPHASWRLIDSGRLDGATNMALDEAILEAVASGDSPPTVRFYGWEPAALSLGYAQEWDVADFDRCAELGWDVVRRATGGRAILHVDELTYSICAPATDPRVEGGILPSYERLSEALLAGLRLLGLEPRRVKSYYKDRGELGPACFDGPANYEIMMGQHKLLGSAQMRKKGVVLQHGTLPLHGDIARIADALAFDSPGQREAQRVRMRYRATTLLNSLGRLVPLTEAADVMRWGFEQTLNLTLTLDQPTRDELRRAGELRAEKYAHDSWTKRI